MAVGGRLAILALVAALVPVSATTSAAGAAVAVGIARAATATTAPARTAHPASASLPRCPAGMPYDFPCRPLRDDYPLRRGTRAQRECGAFALGRTDQNRGSRIGTTARALATTGVARAAADIDDAARRLGWRVDHSPRVGAIGVMERGYRGASRAHGHGFYIARVYLGGVHPRMVIEEYNWSSPYRYDTRTVPLGYPSWVVHIVGPARPHPAVGHLVAVAA